MYRKSNDKKGIPKVRKMRAAQPMNPVQSANFPVYCLLIALSPQVANILAQGGEDVCQVTLISLKMKNIKKNEKI